MTLKYSIEQVRKLIKEARFKEAFKAVNDILETIGNDEMVKAFSLTEGRYNHYMRERMSGQAPEKTELTNIIDAFYNLVSELESILSDKQKLRFQEAGKHIVHRISESFAEIEERDRKNMEYLKELQETAIVSKDIEYILTEVDELFQAATNMVLDDQQAATSIFQRKLGIGYNRAGRIVDQMEALGIIGPPEGAKPRQVLVKNEDDLSKKFERLIKIEKENEKPKCFIIHERKYKDSETEDVYTSELISEYFPILEGTLHELKLIKAEFLQSVYPNLIEIHITLKPIPYDYYDIWDDDDYKKQITCGFMSMGVFLWDLPIIGIQRADQYIYSEKYSGLDEYQDINVDEENYDLVVELVTAIDIYI